MVKENKTKKYLLYAIGEIILVVIGILIALSINNWNQSRIKKNTISNIYSIVKTDLETDILNIDKIINTMAPYEETFIKVINQTMTYQDYKDCKSCNYIISGFPDYNFQNRGFNLLTNESELKDKNNLMVTITDFYTEFKYEFNIDIDAIVGTFYDNVYYWKNNKSWHTDYIRKVENEEFIQYALTSWDYRNRVSNFHIIYYQIYLERLKDYKEKAQNVIKKIDSIKN